MCGIVGLFLKDKSLQTHLGSLLTEMLITMTDRGPDSAGVAIYRPGNKSSLKLTVHSEFPERDYLSLKEDLSNALNACFKVCRNNTHAVIEFPSEKLDQLRNKISEIRPNIRIMSIGETIEIYKSVGSPEKVARRFDLSAMIGSHGIGHTRMATESAITTDGAHPYSTGSDQCLVHNGSLSNHNNLRRKLQREGIQIESENDTEVGAAYLTSKMARGAMLDEALKQALDELDGFYTFVVGTKDGFGVLRDPIACKPAVLAETTKYVAFGSEYRALANLPNISDAVVWEPEPATVYFWSH